MSHTKVTVEWRRGVNGDQGTYTFSPNPTITRVTPGKRNVQFTVPLLDGVIIQNFALNVRSVVLAGVLYNKTNNWDDMETARNNVINGIGTGPGQLHIISEQRHTIYSAQANVDGIVWSDQPRSNYQEYTISFIVPSAKELHLTVSSNTINSQAEII